LRFFDLLGAALAARSLNKALPCSLLGGLAKLIEPWLRESLQARLVSCKLDAVHGAVLMIRKAAPESAHDGIDRK
jgi:glucosamine kinase